jgi:hypothetical protein
MRRGQHDDRDRLRAGSPSDRLHHDSQHYSYDDHELVVHHDHHNDLDHRWRRWHRGNRHRRAGQQPPR